MLLNVFVETKYHSFALVLVQRGPSSESGLPLCIAIRLLKHVVLTANVHNAVFQVKFPLVARSGYLKIQMNVRRLYKEREVSRSFKIRFSLIAKSCKIN